jgi:hypothetical protein
MAASTFDSLPTVRSGLYLMFVRSGLYLTSVHSGLYLMSYSPNNSST